MALFRGSLGDERVLAELCAGGPLRLRGAEALSLRLVELNLDVVLVDRVREVVTARLLLNKVARPLASLVLLAGQADRRGRTLPVILLSELVLSG